MGGEANVAAGINYSRRWCLGCLRKITPSYYHTHLPGIRVRGKVGYIFSHVIIYPTALAGDPATVPAGERAVERVPF